MNTKKTEAIDKNDSYSELTPPSCSHLTATEHNIMKCCRSAAEEGKLSVREFHYALEALEQYKPNPQYSYADSSV